MTRWLALTAVILAVAMLSLNAIAGTQTRQGGGSGDMDRTRLQDPADPNCTGDCTGDGVPDGDQTPDRVRNGSCDDCPGDGVPDGDQTPDRLRDGSCGGCQGACVSQGAGSHIGLLAGGQMRQRRQAGDGNQNGRGIRKRDRKRDGTGDCKGTGSGDKTQQKDRQQKRDGSCQTA